MFKNTLHPLTHASRYPFCSSSSSINIVISSFHGGKSLLCLHVSLGEFQAFYVGSKPESLYCDGKNIPGLLEVLFCKLKTFNVPTTVSVQV